MKITIVTISFNQAQFLRECMESVLNQDYFDFEYIVVDPGSTDGSLEIIKSYSDRIICVFEKDAGAADGLNKGFARATGDIFFYLNSDDVLLPGALKVASSYFNKFSDIDVLCGNAYITDARSKRVRKVYSDSFDLTAAAYGAVVSIQPSTFFRRKAFEKSGRFNVTNRSNWDGELLIDMAMSGAKVRNIDAFLSCYRVHSASITGTGRLASVHVQHSKNMFNKILGRPYRESDHIWTIYYRLKKHLLHPRATFERVISGPVFGTKK